MNYYQVKAKCGHVGRNNYIIKDFYVRAESGKEAASVVRNMPRVKHHHKDAIRDVSEITYEEYLKGIERNGNDNYFLVDNSSDQRMYCSNILYDIQREDERSKKRKHSHLRQRIIETLLVKEYESQRRYAYE